MKFVIYLILISLFMFPACEIKDDDQEEQETSTLHVFNDNLEPRWSSFENINAGKGAGGQENNGAKGHPFDHINAGESITLLDVKGQGMINRMWITIQDRSPEMLRSLKLE